MAKRPVKPQTTTDFSFSSSYIDLIKNGQVERVRVKFPFTTDRSLQGNIPYTDKTLHRYYGGEVPEIGRPNNEKDPKKGAFKLSDQEFRFKSTNPNIKKIGRLEIGTASGIEPLVDEAFTQGLQQGYPTDNPIEVNSKYEPNHSEAEFVVMGALKPSNYLAEKHRYKYPIDPNKSTSDNRLNWQTSPDYMTPTFPNTRYPSGGSLRRTNQYTKSRWLFCF